MKFSKIFLSLVLIVSLVGLGQSISVVDASSTNNVVKYKNCKDLNAKYKNGVSLKAGTKNKVVNRTTKKITYKSSNAVVNAAVYKANIKLDNDNDGIACEK